MVEKSFRLITDSPEDIHEASELLCQSYLPPFTEQEKEEIRLIEDPFARKEEIIKRVAKFTHGSQLKNVMQTLEHAGSPPHVLSMYTYQDYYNLAKGRVLRGAQSKLLHGVYDKNKLVGVSGASPWNPIEFLKNPLQYGYGDFWDHPLNALLFESQIKFALMYLNHPSLEHLRQKVKPNEIVVGGPHSVLNDYKGSKFGIETRYWHHVHAFTLGYKLEVGWCSNPITAKMSTEAGSIPLIEASMHYPDFHWKGKKPFESIVFKSVVPNGDSSWLCVYTLYEDLVKLYKQKQLKSSL